MSTLSKSLFSGFLWTTVQTFGSKVVSIVSQIILAWLLIPDDFGKVSIAMSITGIVFLIQNFGIYEVLVNRGHMFRKVLPLAQTISLLAALICIVVTIGASFVAEAVYQDAEIRNLILLFGLSIPFNTMSVVPKAKLSIDLKFKEISIINLLQLFFTQLLLILFVVIGLDIYSFVLAPVLVSVIRYFYINYIARVNIFFKFTLHHWRYLVSKSTLSFIHAIFQTIIRYSDYLILGIFTSVSEVGLYFMAYSLSVQVIGLLVNSLTPVLFPTLMKIPKSETAKIKEVLLKITALFGLIGMPFAFWQAVVAKPLILLVLDDKWLDTILLVQILSMGIGFRVLGSLWEVALKLQGLFKKQAIYSIISFFVFMILIVPFSYWYGNIGLAIAVSLFNVFVSLFLVYGAFKTYNVKFMEIIYLALKYFALCFIVFGPLFYLTEKFVAYTIVGFIINGVLAPVIYLLVIFCFDNKGKMQMQQLIDMFWKSRRKTNLITSK